MQAPSGSIPHLIEVQDNGDNTVSFVFNTTVSTYTDASSFNVDGNDGISFANAPGTSIVIIDFGLIPGSGVPYTVIGGGVSGFGSGGSPAYPLTGTTT